MKGIAHRDGVFLVVNADHVLAVEDVLFVFDVVGVFRYLGAGFEDEPADGEGRCAVFGADEDALFEALGGIDRLVVDLVGTADQRFRFGCSHALTYDADHHETPGPNPRPTQSGFKLSGTVAGSMKGFRIGSAFGIPIRLDLTFLLVLPVFAYIIGAQMGELVVLLNDSIALGIEPDALTGSGLARYGIGTVVAVGLFVCVVAHEFGHSLVARRYGVPIESITLWLLGGVAQMEEIPEDWKKEFTIAIAGPIVSVLVGGLSYVAFLSVPRGGFLLEATRFTLAYLAIMNVVLAGFNLLPGFPMDGGRILRALLARDRPHAQATQQAAKVGQAFAVMLGFFGLLAGFNIFLIILAFFIYIAAASESKRTVMNAAFEGVTVGDVMTPRERLDVVSPTTTVAEFMDRMFRERHTGYPVVERGAGTATDGASGDGAQAGDRPVGVVTLSDAQDINEVERDAYRVEDVMSSDVQTVTPETPVIDAFEIMQREDIGRLLVVDDDTLVGLVSRTDVMTALEIVKSGGQPGSSRLGNEAGASVGTLERERT
ncbi:MAG: Zn-dependent protease/CBS domain-containing protein [Natronomonas sp.]